MRKNILYLILAAGLVFILQAACSFTDLLGSSGDSVVEQDSSAELPAEAEDPQQQPGQEESPAGSGQEPCKVTFTGSSDLNPGEVFQPGETIQVVWTLTNTSSCPWEGAYTLVNTGGDLQPVSSEVPVSVPVAPGASTEVELGLQIPAQEGSYVSAWKLKLPQGKLLGQGSPPDDPLRVQVKAISSGSPVPNPSPQPTQAPQQSGSSGETLLAGKCFDLNGGDEVPCSDSKADIRYEFGFLGAKFYNQGYTTFGSNHENEPDQSACGGETYAPLPHSLIEEEYFCVKLDPVAATTYGWIRVERFDDQGVTFDYLTFPPEAPQAAPNTSLFVLTQADQLTLLRGECFNVLTGAGNPACSGNFSGFLYEEVTKKSLQVMQLTPQDLTFAGALSSEPDRGDCQNTAFNQSPIWPISEKSYYCYQFSSGNSTYYGWVRPTSFNGQGVTFDMLTWQAVP